MGEVVDLPVITRLDLNPERVLEKALEAHREGKLAGLVIVGFEEDDRGLYFASSISDAGTVGWLMDRAKWKLMQITDELEDEDG